MDRMEITAYLINCQPDEFMAYADQGDKGTVVVGPDGKKFRFSVEQLEKGEIAKHDRLMKTTIAEVAADLEDALDEGDMEREEKEAEEAAAEEPASPAPELKTEPKPEPEPETKTSAGAKSRQKASSKGATTKKKPASKANGK